jgi:hypothetical protein
MHNNNRKNNTDDKETGNYNINKTNNNETNAAQAMNNAMGAVFDAIHLLKVELLIVCT